VWQPGAYPYNLCSRALELKEAIASQEVRIMRGEGDEAA